MAVSRDWCEEHNRGSLAETDGICPECEQREARWRADRLRRETDEFAADVPVTMAFTARQWVCIYAAVRQAQRVLLEVGDDKHGIIPQLAEIEAQMRAEAGIE